MPAQGWILIFFFLFLADIKYIIHSLTFDACRELSGEEANTEWQNIILI